VSAPARFTEGDVTRVLKGARKSGYARVRVSIDPAGNIVVDASNDDSPIEEPRRNPLDRLLRDR